MSRYTKISSFLEFPHTIQFWFMLQNQHHADASPQSLKWQITKTASDYIAEDTQRHKGSAKTVLQSPD